MWRVSNDGLLGPGDRGEGAEAAAAAAVAEEGRTTIDVVFFDEVELWSSSRSKRTTCALLNINVVVVVNIAEASVRHSWKL